MLHRVLELRNVSKRFNGITAVDGISFTFFTSRDVVRHPLVAKIVRAYEAFEQSNEEQPR